MADNETTDPRKRGFLNSGTAVREVGARGRVYDVESMGRIEDVMEELRERRWRIERKGIVRDGI